MNFSIGNKALNALLLGLLLSACGGGGETTTTPADTAAPSLPSVSIDAGNASTNTTVVSLDISATDNVGVSAYYASESATTPAATDAGWAAVTPATNFTATVSFTLSSGALGNNTKTVYVWLKDAAGNVSVSANDAITLVVSDSVSPSVPAVAINAGAASSLSTAVTLDISATDAIGVTAYFASETAATPAANDAGWTVVTPAANYAATVNFTLSSGVVGNNAKTVYVWFKDAAGNVSAQASDAITLVVSDATAPTSPAVSINTNAASTMWTAVTLDISASDNIGVTAYFASEIAATPTATDAGWTDVTPATNYVATVSFSLSSGALGNNTKTVYVWFKDAAGNVSASASDAITLVVSDTTSPSLPNIAINAGASSTSTTTATLNISATDDVGVTAYFASETANTPAATDAGWADVTPATNYTATVNFTLSAGALGNNSKTVYVWFKDAAGNVSAFASDAITLVVSDTASPSAPAVAINTGAASTSSTAVTLDISATDNVGVSAYFASETAATPAATDAGWTAVTPAANFTATVNFTLSAGVVGNNSKTVYVWFKDAAGNVSVSANDAITLIVSDVTAPASPTISINAGAASTTATAASLTISATDSVGVSAYFASETAATPAAADAGWTAVTPATNYTATVSFTLSAGVVGNNTKTVYVWFKDAAGNVSVSANDAITLVVSISGFTAAAPMSTARISHTATKLNDGRVLVVGGWDAVYAQTMVVEIYNPITDTWITVAPMTAGRTDHTATLLPNGKVLISGGYDYASATYLLTAELYDPVANSWAAAPSMSTARSNHTATKLNDGRVLISGGRTGGITSTATAELYDPVANSWAAATSLTAARTDHTATLMNNGKVLVSGGMAGPASGPSIVIAELYDPITNQWSAAGSMITARFAHNATLLGDGTVLVSAGKEIAGQVFAPVLAAELYDPIANSWVVAGVMTWSNTPSTATLLPSGKVLVCGGGWLGLSTNLYDPTTHSWAQGISLSTYRDYHAATLLDNGSVLFSGGQNAAGIRTATADLYW